jgi:hypothetical protein
MSKKDAYYFPHFSNARHDRKLKRIIKEFGVEGYGIYFMLLEVLREQTDLRYPIRDIDLLADEFNTSEAKIKTIIGNYDLFIIDEKAMFFSPKQAEYLQPYFAKSERARNAAILRWSEQKQLPENSKSNANAYANAEQMQCDGNASKVKKSKVKESIVKSTLPALNEVEMYCKERGNGIDPQKWYDHYTANGWMVGRNKMKDWRAAVRTWERNGLSTPAKPARPPSTIKDQDGNDIVNPAYKQWRKDNPHD